MGGIAHRWRGRGFHGGACILHPCMLMHCAYESMMCPCRSVTLTMLPIPSKLLGSKCVTSRRR